MMGFSINLTLLSFIVLEKTSSLHLLALVREMTLRIQEKLHIIFMNQTTGKYVENKVLSYSLES
jgi:hypothetical protein